MSLDIPKKLAPFVTHGVVFHANNYGQFQGSCPFCDDENHLFANGDTGQWDCKKCGENGNVYTFLEKTWLRHLAETETSHYRKLAKDRGLPLRAVKRYKLAWDGDRWLLPVLSQKGKPVDLRRWNYTNRKLMSTAGCSTHLFGLARLREIKNGDVPIVWLCEGEWDAIAFSELLVAAGRHGDAVLGVPGADTFKEEWLEFFRGRYVIIVFDADAAGDRGSKKAYELLKGVAAKVEFVNWPEDSPKGYDLRDYVVSALASDEDGAASLQKLFELVRPYHRHATPDEIKAIVKGSHGFEVLPDSERPTYAQLAEFMSQHFCFDKEMDNAFRIELAVVFSEQIKGPPLWMELVSPPGGGKTLLLTLLQTSDRCLFRSTITPRGLLSGYKDTGRDPSLLAYVNGKTVVVKDGTELIALPKNQQDEVWSILRGAYDGRVDKSFGNGVERFYNLHFSLLMGVTPAIESCPQATLGDRFLRYYLRSNGEASLDDRIDAALDNLHTDYNHEEQAREMVRKFLAKKIERVPPIPAWMRKRLRALAKLVGALRANVERKTYDREDLTYRPSEEVATRLAVQLGKLTQSLAVVDGSDEIHERHYALAERVALDTTIGFHLEIVTALVKNHTKGMTRAELVEELRMPLTTVDHRLDDLDVLGLLQSVCEERSRGAPGNLKKVTVFRLSERVIARWREAGLQWDIPRRFRVRRIRRRGSAGGPNGHSPRPREGGGSDRGKTKP